MQNMFFHDMKYTILFIWSTVSSRMVQPRGSCRTVWTVWTPIFCLKTRFLQN